MACTDCKKVEISTCDNCQCDNQVCTPCDFKLPASCILNTQELTNLGTCNEEITNYKCSDLETILLAIDSLLDNCADGDSCQTVTVDADNNLYSRICQEAVTISFPTGEAGLDLANQNIAYMRFYDSTFGSNTGAIVYVDETEAMLLADNGSSVGFIQSKGNYLLSRVSDNGTYDNTINIDPNGIDIDVSGLSAIGLTPSEARIGSQEIYLDPTIFLEINNLFNYGAGAQNSAALAVLLATNRVYIKEDADGDTILAITS